MSSVLGLTILLQGIRERSLLIRQSSCDATHKVNELCTEVRILADALLDIIGEEDDVESAKDQEQETDKELAERLGVTEAHLKSYLGGGGLVG